MDITTKFSLENCREYRIWETLTQMRLQNENVHFTKRTIKRRVLDFNVFGQGPVTDFYKHGTQFSVLAP
jgi:hypothetical protein